MDPILVWGAGAIGGSVGAWLKRAGHDVHFVDVVPDHVAAIRTTGLRITGPIDQFSVVAPAMLPNEVTGKYRRIFLAVKAHHTAAASTAACVTSSMRAGDQEGLPSLSMMVARTPS